MQESAMPVNQKRNDDQAGFSQKLYRLARNFWLQKLNTTFRGA